ncbi:MAG: helix-turn-helix transcriptional regulator [Bacteroidales bacterium]|nr:helix-turn-helix transcriptional regulator [Bacteroidales bacterium]
MITSIYPTCSCHKDCFTKSSHLQFRYRIGEAIKEPRIKQHLTQDQLGALVGVQKAQISKIESGKSITYATIVKVFKALGATTASMDLGHLGRVVLW